MKRRAKTTLRLLDHHSILVALLLLTLASNHGAQNLAANPSETIVISEVMAANEQTLQDEDGEFSDWIELYNTDLSPVNLNGWYLTDDPATLKKWQFPDVNIPGHGFLLVFCSGKNRRTVDAPLHASFKLSQAGEYLALVRPGGRWTGWKFSPKYPSLDVDVSYGFPHRLKETALVAAGAQGKAFVAGETHPQDGWREIDFYDESATFGPRVDLNVDRWISGAIGFGYDKEGQPSLAEKIRTDISDAMFGKSAALYLRVPFRVLDPSKYDFLHLRVHSKGKFIAYLNGVEVARSDSSGASRRDRDRVNVQHDFDISTSKLRLESGENVLAIHAVSSSRRAKAFVILPELTASSVISLPTKSPRFFTEASPMRPNPHGLKGITPPPKLSIASGLLSKPTRLELTDTSTDTGTDTTIRFTEDGSEPTAESPAYTSPLTIESTTEIKAKSFKPEHVPSSTVTGRYVLSDPRLQDFSSNLPLLIVSTFGRWIGSHDYTAGYLQVLDVGKGGRSSMTREPNFNSPLGIKTRGSSTGHREKASYSIELWNERGADQPAQILGLPADSDWILYGPYNFDRAMIRNAFMYELSNQIGRYAVRTRFVELFVNTGRETISRDDHYVGLYVFMEKIKPGRHRVNLDGPSPLPGQEPIHQARGPESESEGFIVKIDRPDPGDYGFHAGNQSLKYVYPKEGDVTPSQSVEIETHITAFAEALRRTNPNNPDYRDYIDVDSWIDFHILNEFTKNPDGFILSTYMYRSQGGKITMGPIWDFDRTMGPDDDYRAANPRGWSRNVKHNWWRQLFADAEFEKRYRARWRKLREKHMSQENLYRILDLMADQIVEAQKRDHETWSLHLDDGFRGEVLELKQWIRDRLTWIDSQHLYKPDLSPRGGRLSDPVELKLSNSNGAGEIVYTVNGPDPRLSTNKTAPEASVYTGPIEITKNSWIRARIRFENGLWSALEKDVYVVSTPTLAVTEIMYNPDGGPEYEYIELLNFGESPVDLTQFSIRGGIRCDFATGEVNILPPMEYAVVVKNREVFSSRYDASDIKIAAEFRDSLKDFSDRIALVGSVEEPLIRFTYSGRWYTDANGRGHSIVLIDPQSQPETWSQRLSWRASTLAHGSPGRRSPTDIGQVAGDSNQDGQFNLVDSIHFLSTLLTVGGDRLPCSESGQNGLVRLLDTNRDGQVSAADAVYNLSYFFLDGPPPAQGTDCIEIVGCPNVCTQAKE